MIKVAIVDVCRVHEPLQLNRIMLVVFSVAVTKNYSWVPFVRRSKKYVASMFPLNIFDSVR